MKQISFLIAIATLTFFSCKNKTDENFPLPTENTFVKLDAEEGESQNERQIWMEKIHGGKYSNWQNTEFENSKRIKEYKRTLSNPNRDGEEWLAEGKVFGKWIERGSKNQAGSALNACYDVEENVLYALGAGGPLYKGDINGFQWQLVHDDYRFDGNLLELMVLEDGKKRLIASVNATPHYSDDFGLNWTAATGVQSPADGREVYGSTMLNNTLFVLSRRDWWSNFVLYRTSDGETYVPVKIFSTSDGRKIDMNKSTDGKSLYVAEQINNDQLRIHNYNFVSSKMDVINNLSDLSFGDQGKTNLDVVQNSNDTIFYAYDKDNKFSQSKDLGKTWEVLSTLNSTPWGVGVFIAPSNTTKMIYGEVDAFRGSNSGKNWNRINNWYEYYGNVKGKLHADIMFIKEVKDPQGKDVIIIGHHGGISITKDYGVTTENITLYDFNVSQYYDVKSHPNDASIVFAGSQDQGMQRGIVSDEFTSDFHQMISGDYGHITFTNNGEHMWIMYPGGSISFYKNPKNSDGGNFGYSIEHGKEAVWIPPVMANPHENTDVVYVAGGSANANQNGSYIMKLEADQDGITASNLPFNFAASSGGTVSAMAVSPFDKMLWFAATDNGRIYRSTDGGNSFNQVSNMVSGAHYLYGSCIYPSKTDANVVYLTGSGYGNISPVYFSKDAGKTFQPMSSGMPSTVAFKLVANEDESKLYAATENGPYVYLQTEDKWFPLVGVHTPNQTYWSVEYINSEKVARFGTYGRGIWDFNDLSIETKTEDTAEKIEIKIFPNPTTSFVNVIAKEKILQLDIVTIDGKKIQSLSKPSEKIDVDHLPNGQYVMIIKTTNNKISKSFTKI